MNIRKLVIALLLFCSIPFSYAKTEQAQANLIEVPTRGKIFHPGDDLHFQNAINTFDLVIVDFYADWCGPCRSMQKVLEDLATDRDCDDILIIKVNTDTQRDLSNHYHITSLPTIIFFVDGKPIHTVYGFHNKKQMKELITKTFRMQKA